MTYIQVSFTQLFRVSDQVLGIPVSDHVLGITVTDHVLGITQFEGLVDKLRKRLQPWMSKHMSSRAKLLLSNTCLSSLPMYIMGMYHLKGGVHKRTYHLELGKCLSTQRFWGPGSFEHQDYEHSRTQQVGVENSECREPDDTWIGQRPLKLMYVARDLQGAG